MKGFSLSVNLDAEVAEVEEITVCDKPLVLRKKRKSIGIIQREKEETKSEEEEEEDGSDDRLSLGESFEEEDDRDADYYSDHCSSKEETADFVLLNDQDLDPSDKEGEKPVYSVLCLSDTHGMHDDIIKKWSMPQCDLLLHSGDMTDTGKLSEFEYFNRFLKRMKKAKVCDEIVCIAGNHEITLEMDHYLKYDMESGTGGSGMRFHGESELQNPMECMKEIRKECVYLENESTHLFNDELHIYGTPIQPEFFDWAFNEASEMKRSKSFASIPESIDILISHSPPFGFNDRTSHGDHVGCSALMRRVDEIQPAFHVFGHIHSAYGFTRHPSYDTCFINAANVNNELQVVHKPIVFVIQGNRDREIEEMDVSKDTDHW